MEAPLPFLRETLLFLGFVGILIPLLQRLNINQILGFLVAGLVVGPNGLGLLAGRWPQLSYLTFTHLDELLVLADLGVVFLMFLIGLELSIERLWALRRWVFGAGSVQIVLTACIIGAISLALNHSLHVALVLGLVLSLSSTAVVMQLLTQQRGIAQPMGQATFAILMAQDLAVVPILILLDILSGHHANHLAQTLAVTALKSVAVVAGIMLLGRRVIRPLFHTFAKQHQPEVFMALTLLVTLATAAATAAAGLSAALGAFMAGLLLAETEFRHEVEVTIEPFKGLLMALFFMSVGMQMDVADVLEAPLAIALHVLGLLLLKTVVAVGVLRLGGLSWGKAVTGGTLLAQGGEFAFIVLASAAGTGLIKQEVAHFILLAVSLSLMATPLYARLGAALGRVLDHVRRDPDHQLEFADTQQMAGHVVIAGQGRVGRLLAEVLESQRIAYVAIDHDASTVARLVRQDKPVFFGNAARTDLLHKLNTGSAGVLLVTMDQPAAAMHTVKAARQAFPRLPIFARSRDEHHARDLRAAGASAVVPETLEAGLQLSFFALRALGMAQTEVHLALQAEREARVGVAEGTRP